MERKSKKFISLPVVSLEDGNQIGLVKGLVVNPQKREIAGLLIDQKGWFKEQKIINYNKVRSVGTNAITIEKSNNVEKWTNLPEIVNLIKNKYDIIGSKVVTENGVVLGHVDEFYIDEATGKITAIELAETAIEGFLKGRTKLAIEHVRTVGKEVLVAKERAENYLVKLDGGLKEDIKNFKDATSHLWDSFVKKTKEINKTIQKKTESLRKKGESFTNNEECQSIEDFHVETNIDEATANIPPKERPEEETSDASETNECLIENTPEDTPGQSNPSETQEDSGR